MTTIREKVLKEHGLVTTRIAKHKQRQLVGVAPAPDDHLRTSLMRLLELRHHRPIQELITTGSLSQVAKRLKIDPATVSKWKRKLGLREPMDWQDIIGG